jgi:hypothetical protein
MSNCEVLTQVDPSLSAVLKDLRRREPIFHTQEFGTTIADFEKAMSPDYWEIGASGRRYSRAFILQHLANEPPIDASEAGWQTDNHAVRRLGPDTYLFTYNLRQHERRTRRATIWRKTHEGWRILYHQGTIISAEEDDASQRIEQNQLASGREE